MTGGVVVVVHAVSGPLRWGALWLRTTMAGWLDWYLRKGSIQDPAELDILKAQFLPVRSAVVTHERWTQSQGALTGEPRLRYVARIEFRG